MSDTESSSASSCDEEVGAAAERLPQAVVPHAYEPLPQRRDAAAGTSRRRNCRSEHADRTGNDWCQCGECTGQENPANRYCCKEESRIVQRLGEAGNPSCITQHPGYRAIMENVHVLEVAYIDYRTENEPLALPLHKKYRYCAYRQFVKWVWRRLGRYNRKPLPSCVMNRVKAVFPSDDGVYTGFEYVPQLE